MFNFGHIVGRRTVALLLLRNGIESAPERGKRTGWSTFRNAHWAAPGGQRFPFGRGVDWERADYTQPTSVIDLADRAVQPLGMTTNPNEAWIRQMTRNAFDYEISLLCDKRYLIIDHDTKHQL